MSMARTSRAVAPNSAGTFILESTPEETRPMLLMKTVRQTALCLLRDKRWRTRQDSNLWPLPSEGSALSS